jgi:enoyl-CoA hydratase
MSTASEPLVLSEKSSSGKVIILRLNRPKALNALSSPLFDQLNIELEKADADESVGAIVLTGSEKAFAAGADIKEMKDKDCTFGSGPADLSRHDVQEQLPRDMDAYWSDSQAHHWRRVRLCRKSSH